MTRHFLNANYANVRYDLIKTSIIRHGHLQCFSNFFHKWNNDVQGFMDVSLFSNLLFCLLILSFLSNDYRILKLLIEFIDKNAKF